MEFIKGHEAKAKKIIADNQDDSYSRATMGFAVQWADLIESELAAGKALPDVADACSDVASRAHGGVTGFMAGCAAGFLGEFWTHGEELRHWWNSKYGVSEDEAKGRTVNPAIVTVG